MPSPLCLKVFRYEDGGFLFNRKLRSLLNKKPSGQDAHAAMRDVTALRYCGGAQSVQAPED